MIPFSAHFGGSLTNMGIYISSARATTGSIKVGNSIRTFSVAPGQITRFIIGPAATADFANTGVYMPLPDALYNNAAIEVQANADVAVFVQIIRQFTTGASLALPQTTWGNNYVVPNYPAASVGNGFLNIIAAEPNTTVEITPSATSSNGIRTAGNPYLINLPERGSIYQLQFASGVDVSGTRIRSVAGGSGTCQPIAVFAGHTWAFMGCADAFGGDNLYQQIFPTNAWGQQFIGVPFVNEQTSIFRVFTADSTAVVSRNELGSITNRTIAPHSFWEFSTGNFFSLQSSQPIMVVQYMRSQSCDPRNSNLCGNNGSCLFPGDPEMVLLNPTEQYIDSISVFSAHRNWVPPGESAIDRCYLAISIPTAAAASFRINGAAPTAAFVPVSGTGYSVLIENVTTQAIANPVQNLTADRPFSCIAYGVGNFESYAYNAGSGFSDLRQQIGFDSINASGTICRLAPTRLWIDLPYEISAIRWLADNQPIGENNPGSFDSSFVRNGVIMYRYRLQGTVQFGTAGAVQVRAWVLPRNSTACNGEIAVNTTLQIAAAPSASFVAPPTICLGDTLTLSANLAGAPPNTAWTWQWQSNQASGATLLLPATDTGQLRIALSGTGTNGCASDTAFQITRVQALPLARLKLPNVICAQQSFLVRQTNIATIARHQWTYNGMLQNTTADSLWLNASNNNTASLQVQTTDSNGCRSNLLDTMLLVEPTPQAAFTVPGICLNDAIADFVNQSTYGPGFTNLGWRWHFGDVNASAANPDTASDVDGRHRYSATGNYVVTLIATATTGCADTLAQTLTVNAANPVAGFELLNSGLLCSNDSIRLRNRSSVGFGNITRIELYWNWGVNNSDSLLTLMPSPTAIWAKSYLQNGAPGLQNVSIRLVAYSGQVCVDDTIANISIAPAPHLVISPLPLLCSDAPPLPLTQAREQNGLAGTGSWSGPGVQGDSFVPSRNRLGNNLLTYSFRTADGCSDTVQQSIVVAPTPTADAGTDRIIGAGATTLLAGSTNAAGSFRVQWLPPGGLSNAQTLQPQASPATTTRYRLQINTAEGCTATDSVLVSVLINPVVPNAFSPNGDGINDGWNIIGLSGYTDLQLLVFDRYGREVYSTRSYNQQWQGNATNGRPLPTGVYYYLISSSQNRLRLQGSVTIVR
ncbi:MAG: gliding motility-associated C-terminal domain-containing protein [Chitinophagaceae bacterium]|nr:gliding motility-associated C-terminal domain-containing protein [Chitinophagaceae bacterium]